jgi:TldD protein
LTGAGQGSEVSDVNINRRNFLRQASVLPLAAGAELAFAQDDTAAGSDPLAADFDRLAEVALGAGAIAGASYVDFRIERKRSERIATREQVVRGIHFSERVGYSVRVLVNGTWGFAAGNFGIAGESDDLVRKSAREAVATAEGLRTLQSVPVVLEEIPAYQASVMMPVEVDPFAVALEEKAEMLLKLNAAAAKAGANFCNSGVSSVSEEKWFASSRGSRIAQARTRIHPQFSVTVLDQKKGGYATRNSFSPPTAAGFEIMRAHDFAGEAALAVEQASEKMAAPSVQPGPMDIVIAPSNLWLTIHETVGHPTELDRALGYEANYAGTSFATPDKLDNLQYGSELVTIVGDRTQESGLATVAFDDDGVKTAGKEFKIIDSGKFRNYQMALGQAQKIGRKESNGCAYADSHDSFPIQRMPNISLQPGKEDIGAEELIADVEDGIFIEGSGSWSIDQQRYNFQFTGQVFHRIRGGKVDGMLRDVAYQGNSVDFWKSCDGLGGKSSYQLGGAFNCGKGRPGQVAPVSHGAVPARFRQVNILNTEQEAGKQASKDRIANSAACRMA